MTLQFTIHATDGGARSGVITTAHGQIHTPAFMPVGTAATVKGMHPEAVAATGADIILGNTYHLMLRPGAERIARLGGLHQFMHWNRPILTDSGGFQVMSLAALRTLTEASVTFKSHIDGTMWELSPERAIEIQHLLGSTITMVLDECTPYPVSADQAERSMQLSMRWAARSKAAFVPRAGYGLFGIVQGSTIAKLRQESVAALTEIGFDGYAIGGLAVGEGQAEMFRVLDFTVPAMPADKPRYLMGVGKPEDIVGAVLRGVDMFDCVIPTRSARFGRAYTSMGEINIRNARHAEDPRPLDPSSTSPVCRSYSRAYLHHLFKADEMLGPMLLTLHNLHYYQELMAGLRAAISERCLEAHVAGLKAAWQKGDIAPLTS
ncbi:MAG: tRNA guanosine(34) transglycosylase Tgt [Alphaproteobacteria bacterium]